MKYIKSFLEKNTIKGGKSDNLSVEDIAKKFNIPVSKIKHQLELGIKVESEHTNDKQEQREIAMSFSRNSRLLRQIIRYGKES